MTEGEYYESYTVCLDSQNAHDDDDLIDEMED